MSDFEIKIGHQQGWECPKCGRVYTPWVRQCSYCGNDTQLTTITTGFSETIGKTETIYAPNIIDETDKNKIVNVLY